MKQSFPCLLPLAMTIIGATMKGSKYSSSGRFTSLLLMFSVPFLVHTITAFTLPPPSSLPSFIRCNHFPSLDRSLLLGRKKSQPRQVSLLKHDSIVGDLTSSYDWLKLQYSTRRWNVEPWRTTTRQQQQQQQQQQSRCFSSPPYLIQEFSFADDNDDHNIINMDEIDQGDDDDLLLSYLSAPDDNDWEIPPMSQHLLDRATLQYIRGNATTTSSSNVRPIHLQDVLSILQQEYNAFDVPIKVGKNLTLDVTESGDELEQNLVQIISFCALYGVPKEIVMILLGVPEDDIQYNDKNGIIDQCRAIFSSQRGDRGWSAVSFPKGLGIHVKRHVSKLHGERYSLPRWPWQRWRLSTIAKRLVRDAARAQPPRQRLMSEKEFLTSLSQELRQTAIPDNAMEQSRIQRLTFFPNQNNHPNYLGLFWKRLQRAIQKQGAMLRTAGRAGTISYGFLNFLFYAGGILFQWRSLSSPTTASMATTTTIITTTTTTVGASLRKLGQVFGVVYLGSQVTKLPRLLLAVALAPLGDRALQTTKEKLRVSENTALVILTTSLLAVFIAVLTTIVVGDVMATRQGMILK